ncbi:MAG: ABC transporter substrate-binding protein [Caldilineaceae bacterium]|nr:ABC transporter substrate-binding protein [Caldilineaceae bacterium]
MKQTKFSWLLGIVMVVSLVLSGCVGAAEPAEPAEEMAAPAEEEAEESAELPQIVPIEGPDIILDEAMWPTEFSEAPSLAEMVAAGDLPPVEDRLPEDPMVIKPLGEIGKYGGTWRRGFTGPADGENMMRINNSSRLLAWDYSGSYVVPSLLAGWDIQDEGRKYILYLRKGAKWSDGMPFTADDFLFWYEDVALNPDIFPSPPPEMVIAGEPGLMEKIDDYTISYTFKEPYPLFLDILAGHNMVAAAPEGSLGTGGGGYAAKHYMSQFLPKYSSEEEVTAKAKELGFESWLDMYLFHSYPARNPDLPVMSPWVTERPVIDPIWSMKRNPYYWAVDTEGNQLPYIDEIVINLAEDREVLLLRALAGEIDFQGRHISISRLPVLIENMGTGDYRVDIGRGFCHSAGFHFNHSYDGDDEIQQWIRNVDFRRALSLGIDRDQINEAYFLGLGVGGSVMCSPDLPSTAGEEYVTKWATHEPDQANEMLDAIGLTEKDDEGFRLRTDGSGERLRIEIGMVAGGNEPIAEMVKDHWKDIGIWADLKAQERSLFETEARANKHQIGIWGNGGASQLWLYPRHVLPVNTNEAYMGPEIARWFVSGGEDGMAPPYPEMERALELFRKGATVSAEERNKIGQEIWMLVVDQVWSMGTVGQSAGVAVTKNNMGNVPRRGCPAQHCRTPASGHPPTWYFTDQ